MNLQGLSLPPLRAHAVAEVVARLNYGLRPGDGSCLRLRLPKKNGDFTTRKLNPSDFMGHTTTTGYKSRFPLAVWFKIPGRYTWLIEASNTQNHAHHHTSLPGSTSCLRFGRVFCRGYPETKVLLKKKRRETTSFLFSTGSLYTKHDRDPLKLIQRLPPKEKRETNQYFNSKERTMVEVIQPNGKTRDVVIF